MQRECEAVVRDIVGVVCKPDVHKDSVAITLVLASMG